MGVGKPEEYFNRITTSGRVLITREDFMQPAPKLYIERIKRENTLNSVFGLKVHYSQLARFPEILENFTQIFPDAKYISITRRNILRQATSDYRAKQTQAWISHLPEQKKPRFNIFGIIKHLISVAQEIELWEKFYAKHNIKPLRLLYEDLEADYESTMREVISFLGISGDIPAPPMKKQADTVNEAWVERFIAFFRGNGIIIHLLRFVTNRW